MVDVSSQLVLVFCVTLDYCLFLFAYMNFLNWALPTGRKSRVGRGASSSATKGGVHPKQGLEDRPPSPVIGVSSRSSGQRREQLPPHPTRVSSAAMSVASSSELSDSMACYLEAFKTSLGDITPGEWNILDGLTNGDTMGAATRAAMMVRHSLTQCTGTSSSLNLDNTTINLRREQVFYIVWRKYPDLDFLFLREGILGVIEGFKAKSAEKANPITEILDDKTQQAVTWSKS